MSYFIHAAQSGKNPAKACCTTLGGRFSPKVAGKHNMIRTSNHGKGIKPNPRIGLRKFPINQWIFLFVAIRGRDYIYLFIHRVGAEFVQGEVLERMYHRITPMADAAVMSCVGLLAA